MIQVFTDNDFKDTNAYLIYNEKKQGILIDTAYERYKDIISFVKKNDINLTDVFITHGHFAHFYGINEICEILNIENVYIGRKDMIMLFDANKNTSILFTEGWCAKPLKNLKVIDKELELKINGFLIKTIASETHTDGSMIIEFPEIKCIFNGDTLFLHHDVIGPTNSLEEEKRILENIKWIFKNYSKGYSFFPGHFDYGFTIRDVLDKDNYIKKKYKRLINYSN
ncbi:MBL fold metallo-hydrolase [Spiroplasma tabanidicola]|uniref:Hydroxyacylglutathione hydrolase n=1 Tax=Spiroplasma tabanidicola TaxID=324079 RepID=A0A6I6CIN7_9MOLU|nr:MBL fold metallo-hydrolase [Spiroplasma tabanidicola]QGS51933.1 hydroxyacylglutathione hydrolase [Spiroplasma tabanidicola]